MGSKTHKQRRGAVWCLLFELLPTTSQYLGSLSLQIPVLGPNKKVILHGVFFLPFHRIDAISISFICKCYQISQTVISLTQIPRSWNISSKVLKGSQLHESSEWKGKRARCRSSRLVHDTSCSSTRASDQLSSDQCFREATSNVARRRAPSTSQVKPRGSHPLSSVNHS